MNTSPPTGDPTFVEVTLPALDYGGLTREALTVRIKDVQNPLEAPALQLEPEILEHIRLAILAGSEYEGSIRRCRRDPTGSKQVRYSIQKDAYVAYRFDEAPHKVVRWKTFNHHKRGAKGNQETMLKKALKWAEGDDDDDDDEVQDDPEGAQAAWDAAAEITEASASLEPESLEDSFNANSPDLRSVASPTHSAPASALDTSPGEATESVSASAFGDSPPASASASVVGTSPSEATIPHSINAMDTVGWVGW